MNPTRIGLLALLAVALCVAHQLAEARLFGDSAIAHFERHRASRCPEPGVEHKFDGKITIKVANFPKEACKDLCARKDLESLVGEEQLSMGPVLYCCCA